MPEKSKGRRRSKESVAREADFIPGTESNEDFDKVLSLLSGWVSAGVVHPDLDSDGDVVFDLPVEMRDLFGAEIPTGLTKEQVVRIIRMEIPPLIGAGLAENPKQYLRFHIPETLHGKLDAFVERSPKAVTSLVSKDLRDRILLRRTTLSYVIKGVQAVGGSYDVRSSAGDTAAVRFTGLEFTFVRPRSPKTVTFAPAPEGFAFTIGQKDEIQVRVDLHKDDIKALVRDLTELIEKDDTQ